MTAFDPARRGSSFTRAALAAFALLVAFAHPAFANINDNFDRANSATIGNGWVEKNGGAAFSINANGAQKAAAGTGYLNNLVYRPAGEDVADVEASVEFRLTGASPGYPQLFTRIESATADFNWYLVGYMLYINDSNGQAILGRQVGSPFVTTLATIALAPALNTTDTFRMRLRAVGASPVQLTAWVERLNGGSWQILGQASYSDTAAERIVAPGSVGFSGYVETSYTFDNFVRTNLSGPSNPIPILSGVNPTSALQGETGFTLTANGSNFVNGSVVRWNGADRTTTFVNSNTLEAQITAADLATAGAALVSVFTPAPGGGTSGTQNFTINPNATPNPVPATSGLAPNTATAGSPQFTLTVNGSNFATGAVVRWNGANRTTTFVNAGQLTATIAAADIAAAGTASVTVFNPTPGGGTSNAQTFTITAANNPVPTTTGISPTSAIEDGAGFTLTVNGTNFVGASVVRWGGANRTTTFVSATRLTATIPASDITTPSTVSVTVFNPTPGGGTSNGQTFTITAAGGGGGTPALTTLSPISTTAGSGSLTVTINGSGFISGSQARWNGNNRTTTFVNSSQIRIALTSSDVSSQGMGAITVANSSNVSQPLSFFMMQSGGAVFFDGFNRSNSNTVGNGWTEKYEPAFAVSNNAIAAGDTYPFDYHDAIIYRTNSGEDQLNVEVGAEFVRNTTDRFVQLHARAQRNTIQDSDTLESYILYIEDNLSGNGGMAIAVQPPVRDVGECIISIISFPQPLQNGTRYRLRFRVQNPYPVQLTAIIERWDGNVWQAFASGNFTHDNNTPRNPSPDYFCPYAQVPLPVTTAGTVGLAKWWTPTGYDNYHWRSLDSGGTSIPSVTSMSPNSTAQGSSAFTLTVNGGGFNSNSVVRWNGSNRTTTFISGTQLQAAIPASDVASAGNATVTVFNSGTGGGTSPTSLTFVITPPVSASFVDEFNRPDSDAIGNSWIEKMANAFFIVSQRAAKQSNSGDYRDNLVYRPASENVLNVEASMQMRVTSTFPGYPQLFVRGQTGTIATAGTMDAYMMYVDNSASLAVLGRQRGTTFVETLAFINISPSINTTDTYRLRLSASGTTSVQLQAYVERLNGGSWQIIGQASFTDTAANRISTAGTVGFGGYTENTYSFDTFTRTVLP